jgi:hypothetical protein
MINLTQINASVTQAHNSNSSSKASILTKNLHVKMPKSGAASKLASAERVHTDCGNSSSVFTNIGGNTFIGTQLGTGIGSLSFHVQPSNLNPGK